MSNADGPNALLRLPWRDKQSPVEEPRLLNAVNNTWVLAASSTWGAIAVFPASCDEPYCGRSTVVAQALSGTTDTGNLRQIKYSIPHGTMMLLNSKLQCFTLWNVGPTFRMYIL